MGVVASVDHLPCGSSGGDGDGELVGLPDASWPITGHRIPPPGVTSRLFTDTSTAPKLPAKASFVSIAFPRLSPERQPPPCTQTELVAGEVASQVEM